MRLTTIARAAANLCAAAALAGCSSVPGRFDNLITVSLTGDRAFLASMYGPIGITAELRAEDARELQVMREKARMLDLLVKASSAGSGL